MKKCTDEVKEGNEQVFWNRESSEIVICGPRVSLSSSIPSDPVESRKGNVSDVC